MAQISIETSQARSAVNSIRQKGNNARDIINQVDREIKAVEGWWKGESSRAFVDEFRALKPNLDKMVQCIEDYSKMLNQVIEVQERADQDIARQIRR